MLGDEDHVKVLESIAKLIVVPPVYCAQAFAASSSNLILGGIFIMSPSSIVSALDISLCPHKHFRRAMKRKESFDETNAVYDSKKLDLDVSRN